MGATNSLRNERAPGEAPAEVRCHCGSLMARLTPEGLELKCRRCKRVVVVAADKARDWVTVALHSQEVE